MKTIVAGSRSITKYKHVVDAINLCGWIPSVIIEGEASGVDTLAKRYGWLNNIPVDPHPAAWQINGYLDKGAGAKRNQEMANIAEALVLVWDWVSTGSKDMLDRARKKGLKVFVYIPEEYKDNE